MVMKFCPKCESIMVPKKKEDGSTVLVCENCGYTLATGVKTSEYTITFRISHSPREEIVVLKEEPKVRRYVPSKDERVEAYKEALEFYEEWEYGSEGED